jgi:lysozyme
MKIIITESQLNVLNKTIQNITDPFKILGIKRPSEPQNPSNKKLMDGSSIYATDKYWAHIREYEGNPKNRVGGVKQPVFKAYKDSVGVWTVGYGHTGSDVKPNMKITKQQADEMLKKDSQVAADCVRRIMDKWKKDGLQTYKLTQGQFDTLVSLTFNAGCGSVRKSQFIKELKKGNTQKAGELIKTFNTLNLPGLVRRRADEYKIFTS